MTELCLQVKGIKSLSFVAACNLDICKKIFVFHFFVLPVKQSVLLIDGHKLLITKSTYIFHYFFLMGSVQPFVGVNNYTSSSHTFKKSHTCNHAVRLNIRKAMLTSSMELLYNNSVNKKLPLSNLHFRQNIASTLHFCDTNKNKTKADGWVNLSKKESSGVL